MLAVLIILAYVVFCIAWLYIGAWFFDAHLETCLLPAMPVILLFHFIRLGVSCLFRK
jgi:hypothetical protein